MTTADAIYDSIVTAMVGDSRVTQSKMFGSPGLKVNGKVFAVLVKGQLVVKLPRQRVDALVAAGQGEYFDPGMGRLMKEWVSVPVRAASIWPGLAKEALAFVGSGK